MRKAITLILALALCMSLAACGHQHSWAEATCTEPKTCTECGKTEDEPLGHDWAEASCAKPSTCTRCSETQGEPLPHTWVDATCTEPKTCSVCGATEGEALGHTLSEANYQDAPVCTVCGETVGEPLTPDFVTYGIAADLVVGEHYALETNCYDDPAFRTVADVSVVDYNIFEADDTHEAKDGYEWRVATFQLVFSDENAWNYGYYYSYCMEDYYDIRLHDDTATHDDDGNATYTVNYHGEDKEVFCRKDMLYQGWDDQVATCTFLVSYRVPVGYDGCVFGVMDKAIEYPEDGYIFDVYDPASFLPFRFA